MRDHSYSFLSPTVAWGNERFLGSCGVSQACGAFFLVNEGFLDVLFRDSKLTMLLSESLGNINCRTTMIAHISDSPTNYMETLTTVQLASRIHRMRKKKSKVLQVLCRQWSLLLVGIQHFWFSDTDRQSVNSSMNAVDELFISVQILKVQIQFHDNLVPTVFNWIIFTSVTVPLRL